MPCFVHAYTAPDNNDYEYKITGNTGASYWYTVYSNNKICFCSESLYCTVVDGTNMYKPIGVIENNETLYAGQFTTKSYSNNIDFITAYPQANININNNTDYKVFLRDVQTPTSNTYIWFESSNNIDIPIFEI